MRCVHLDFHTGPDIENIGELFDAAEFAKTAKDAKVESMTVFAKCHHGYTYYPSKLSAQHPHLHRNLLQEQIDALHGIGIKAPIYITMGFSKKDADEHPEWHHMIFNTQKALVVGTPDSTDLDAPIPETSWVALCPVGSYQDHLKALTREVCETFDVSDGIFYDICFMGKACVCDACKTGMKAMGLDPENYDDAKQYYIRKRIEMMKTLTGIVHEYAPNATVFYNGGAEVGQDDYHPYQTHYEMEGLPTTWWGSYDLMPLRTKYFERYGKPYLGMTGKFHHIWGEFGGFKNPEALRYECANLLSEGAGISIGDHLHPSGKIDKSTYAGIGHAFSYIEKIERYSQNTRPHSDIALWMTHVFSGRSDLGVSSILQTMHQEFCLVGSGSDLTPYRCIILPDGGMLSEEDKRSILAFLARGGKLITSYDAAFPELGIEKQEPSAFDQDYIAFDMEEITTPFLAYSSAYKVKTDGTVLATVYEPYFNRTFRHFCGHKNTPNRTEPAEYPALVKVGNVLYFAHPIFEAYYRSGSYALEQYIIRAIESVYEKNISVANLPASGRVRLRESTKENFLALHTLYTVPVHHGMAYMLTDFPTLHDVTYRIKVDHPIAEVVAEPTGERIPFVLEGNTVTFQLPPFSLHQLVLLKW